MATAIKYAQVNELSNQYKGGKYEQKTNKILGGFFLLIFLAIIILPLFLFSDIFNEKNKILSSSITVFAIFPT